ncbi:hypothetical protein K2173_020490 [Erythroxylum novogranatense]|uniref:Protein kinase domain-containing protein n=1 Tax=Erythroxylum novogranatense TaxID=1862640 RepID=A0AAV8TJ29_9ROSI|nr:hypothetical protein K2173_020490 [Erythroxylum novogranatense]
MMDQEKTLEQVRYKNVVNRSDGLGLTNQRLIHDPSTNANGNIRPPDYNMFSGARPVLNYSIQTGEEFALEFMRDRVNTRQHLFPNSYTDPNSAPGYVDLKGMLGVPLTGSESGSKISMLGAIDRGHNEEFERKGLIVNEAQNYYKSLQSVPRTSSSRNDSCRGIHKFPSSGVSDSSINLKFLCSFGGTILPRPSDGKVRYVGGETRIIRLSKNISWQELRQKISAIYDQVHDIKYQLPGEDLDALVSVSCDEDLQNMMDECTIMGDGGSEKLRMFLFSINDLEDLQFGLENKDGDSEFQYVVAVNSMDLGSRKNSINLASTSGNDLDELLSLNVERESGRVGDDLPGGSTSNVPLSTTQCSQPLYAGHPSSYNSTSQPYQNQKMHSTQPPVSFMPLVRNFLKIDGEGTDSSSVVLPHSYGSQLSNHLISGGSSVSVPSQGYPIQQCSYSEDPTCGSCHVQDVEAYSKDAKLNTDNSNLKLNEPKRSQVLDKEASLKELKMKQDGYFTKLQETVESQILECENQVSLIPNENHVPTCESRQEVSAVNLDPGIGLQNFPLKSNKKLQEMKENSIPLEAVNDDKRRDEDKHASAGRVNHGWGGSEADPTDFGYLEPHLVQHIFHSERIPREQAELNQLSKSDGSFDPQVIITQASSSLSQTLTHLVDKLSEENAASHMERSFSTAKAHYANSQLMEEGMGQFEKHRECADITSRFNPNVLEGLGSNGQKLQMGRLIFNSLDDHEMARGKGEEAILLVNQTASQGNFDNHHEESAFLPSKVKQFEVAANKDDNDNDRGNVQPLMFIKNSARAVSQGVTMVGIVPSEQGDISVDINDRFPRDIMSDILSEVRNHENLPCISPINAIGLSVNLQNHDPKLWSYFQNLAQDQFVRKDVSLIDQDHPGFSSSIRTVEGGVTADYSYQHLKADGVAVPHIESHNNFEEDIQQEISDDIGSNARDSRHLNTNYGGSVLKGKDSMQLEGLNTIVPKSEYEIIKNEDLEELRELGSGTFGTVYHGKWRGTDVAIKRIKKSCFTGRSSEQERLTVEFWREAEILSKAHHPNVVAFYGVVQDGPGGTLATVTEFMVNGSLRQVLLSKDRHLDHHRRLIIAMDAAFGMEYLHSKNIVHFDLKCDNLLVNLKDHVRPICKVGDFGLSKIKRNTLVSGGVKGTLPWMAPELLNGGSSKVSEKVDVFSFGIVLWEILTGEEPYANMHYGAIIGGIVSNTLRPPVPSSCDAEWRLLMEQCWAPDPGARPTFTEIAGRLRVMSAACQTRQQGLVSK